MPPKTADTRARRRQRSAAVLPTPFPRGRRLVQTAQRHSADGETCRRSAAARSPTSGKLSKSDEGGGSVKLTAARGNGRTRTAVSRRLVRLLVLSLHDVPTGTTSGLWPTSCKGEEEESEKESNATLGSDDDNDWNVVDDTWSPRRKLSQTPHLEATTKV